MRRYKSSWRTCLQSWAFANSLFAPARYVLYVVSRARCWNGLAAFSWTTCSPRAVLKRKENFKLETTIFSHHKKLHPSVLSSQDYCYWVVGGGGRGGGGGWRAVCFKVGLYFYRHCICIILKYLLCRSLCTAAPSPQRNKGILGDVCTQAALSSTYKYY